MTAVSSVRQVVSELICAVEGEHDYPEENWITKQCRRCGKWWSYYD